MGHDKPPRQQHVDKNLPAAFQSDDTSEHSSEESDLEYDAIQAADAIVDLYNFLNNYDESSDDEESVLGDNISDDESDCVSCTELQELAMCEEDLMQAIMEAIEFVLSSICKD